MRPEPAILNPANPAPPVARHLASTHLVQGGKEGTGVGTLVAEGKKVIEVEGHEYLLELALRADFSLIRAKRADYLGNLEYALTARNFNPLMAMASYMTSAAPP